MKIDAKWLIVAGVVLYLTRPNAPAPGALGTAIDKEIANNPGLF